MRRLTWTAAVATLVGGLVFAPAAQAATTCTPSKWPAPAGAELYAVTETDGHGTYIGWASFSNGTDTIVWHANGTIERLQDFGASDINSNGVMSGSVIGSNGVANAAVRTPSGDITTLSGARSSAVALNDRGDVVGYELYPPPAAAQIVFAWQADGSRTEGLSAWGFATPDAVDEGGLVPFTYQWRGVDTGYIYQLIPGGYARRLQTYSPVGTVNPIELVDAADGLVLATRTESGQESEIVLIEPVSGTITPVPGTRGATPVDVNNGVVVGESEDRATMWRNGETVVLPALAGSTPREATLVNADGTEIIGESWDADGYFATLWRCSR